ncbi:hypothetical protein K491DRAFT_313862 [Lophiostoma macrostomum CBS 122681]|uniref:Uncharacterized protein n=1 Tax=Lophiostoma macrostomum CBS 122681 TaxID=1314788 RepID=A0A6A6SIW3_9PLEO|nr:hypothetical protein K491DRAFT_313862 [Lophiostoma macrostomum CBS 122681]
MIVIQPGLAWLCCICIARLLGYDKTVFTSTRTMFAICISIPFYKLYLWYGARGGKLRLTLLSSNPYQECHCVGGREEDAEARALPHSASEDAFIENDDSNKP